MYDLTDLKLLACASLLLALFEVNALLNLWEKIENDEHEIGQFCPSYVML